VKPGAVFEFIERDDGYLDATDAALYFSRPEDWSEPERWACDRAFAHCAQSAKGGRILDVGAGAGRHALHLQERGAEVVALDVSPLAGEVCRRRGARRVFTGTVFDLAEHARASGERFDAFLLIGNNLGLLGGAAHAPTFLSALASLARPDAVILGAGMDPYATANELHRGYHARNRTLGRMGGQIRMRVRHKDLATGWFDYLFTTADELRDLVEGTAWRLEQVEQGDGGPGYVAQLRLKRDEE